MANYVTETSDKSKKIAFALCVFFGVFGAHYFYVGRFKMGLIYLFTLGLFMFGWIKDIKKIIMGEFHDNLGTPLRK